MTRRRSLSEVIGALVVLTVVIVATISMLRLTQQVVSYAQRASSQEFVRSAQEATPPTMSVLVSNSTLYMLISYPGTINISYALLNVDGKLIINRVDRLVAGEAVIPLLNNYSCQNVSITLVSSAGAVFRYVPSEDPALRGRVPPGVYYFSCSLTSGQQGRDSLPSGNVSYYPVIPVGSAAAGSSEYVVGLNYGQGFYRDLGALRLTVKATGWFCSGFNVTISVNGTSLSGSVRAPSSGTSLSVIGNTYINGTELDIMAFASCNPSEFGISLAGPATLLNFTGSESFSGYVYSGWTQPPVLLPEVLGLTGNTTGWMKEAEGPDVVIGSSWYYNYQYSGSAEGWGTTTGPIELAAAYNKGFYGTYHGVSLVANLTVLVFQFTGMASARLQLPYPVSYWALKVLWSSGSPITEASAETDEIADLPTLMFETPYGNVTRTIGTSPETFYLPFYGLVVRSPEPPLPVETIGLRYNTTYTYGAQGAAIKAYLWAYRLPEPIIVPFDPMAFINDSHESYLLVVPVANDSTGLYVNGVYEPGPVVAAPLGSQLAGALNPEAANMTVQAQISVGAWEPVNTTWLNLTAGAYELYAGNGRIFVLVTS